MSAPRRSRLSRFLPGRREPRRERSERPRPPQGQEAEAKNRDKPDPKADRRDGRGPAGLRQPASAKNAPARQGDKNAAGKNKPAAAPAQAPADRGRPARRERAGGAEPRPPGLPAANAPAPRRRPRPKGQNAGGPEPGANDHAGDIAWAYSLQGREHAVPGRIAPAAGALGSVPASLLGRSLSVPHVVPDPNLKIADLLAKLGIKPGSLAVYEEAFTHNTYTNEHPEARSYQRLEFLGDSIIGFLTARFLFEMSSDGEGAMTRDRISIVQAKTLTRAAVELELGKYLRVGAGMRAQPVTAKMLEDCFEAFVGALYLDQRETAVNALLTKTIFRYYLNNDLQDTLDYKTRFQEYVHAAGGAHRKIAYRHEKRAKSGYFQASVAYDGRTVASGIGPQLRDAEIDAARAACEALAPLSPEKRKKRLLGG